MDYTGLGMLCLLLGIVYAIIVSFRSEENQKRESGAGRNDPSGDRPILLDVHNGTNPCDAQGSGSDDN